MMGRGIGPGPYQKGSRSPPTSEHFFPQYLKPSDPSVRGFSSNTLELHAGEGGERRMGSRLGRRIIHFANLPIKLQMPKTLDNIREISLKTVPSASKIEIKRVLESLYGFDVEKVTTLNMEGKKKKRGGLLLAKPDYKKAYVTLKTPLSLSRELYPVKIVQEEKKVTDEGKMKGKKPSVLEDGEDRRRKHWLDGDGGDGPARERRGRSGGFGERNGGSEAKFPWSFMKSRGGKSS